MAVVDQPAETQIPLPKGEEFHPQGSLRVIVVTPERTVLDEETNFVALTLYDGEVGVMPMRAAMLGRLGYGEMRIGQGLAANRFYVDGGFVEVSNNVVSVLTNRAIPAGEIEMAEAEQALAEARGRKANTPELFEIRDRLEAQARAQFRVASRV